MLPIEGYSHRKQENVNKKPRKGFFVWGEEGEGGRRGIVGGGEKEGVCLVEGVRADGGVFPLYSVMPCNDAFPSFPRRGESSFFKTVIFPNRCAILGY